MTQANHPEEEPRPPIAFGSTVTILFSDIRGFTEYTEDHGDEAAYRMLQHHNSLLEEQIALHGGHVVKSLGDSFMVSFSSARSAVTCAEAVQRALDQYNRSQQGPKIEIGIGINTGEPVQDANDLFGGAVNLASRVCAAAGAGRTLVSETVRHVVGRMEGAEWIDRGFFEIKGFQQPQHLFEVDWAGRGAVRATPVAPPQGIGRSAAVAAPLPKPSDTGGKPGPGWTRIGLALAALVLVGVAGATALRIFQGSATPQSEPLDATTSAGERIPLPGGLAGRLLFNDDFSNPNAGLFETSGKGDNFEYRYLDGQFRVRVFASQPQWALIPPVAGGQTFSDFAAELEARAVRLPEAAEYGLGFRGAVAKGQYYLGVRPDSQTWRLAIRRGLRDADFQLLSSGISPAISKGSEPNRILVVAKGTSISAYANGQLLTTIADDTLREGFIFIQARNSQPTDAEGIAVSFSDFKVYSLTP